MIETQMKSKRILYLSLSIMAALIVAALLAPDYVTALLERPSLYPHALFVHVVASTLFFGNAVIGILWESRSLASRNAGTIISTYKTVTWIDAHFSAPMIILGVLGGVTLSVILGDLWQTGWLSLAFLLFLFSGVIWISFDIPTQYKIRERLAELDPGTEALPPDLLRLLKRRLWISIGGVAPLVIVFALMIYKPDIIPVGDWFR